MRKARIVGFVAIVSLLSGCAPDVLRSARSTTIVSEAETRETAGIVFTEGNCSQGGSIIAAVAAPLIGMAVDFGTNAIGAALKQWKEGRNAMWYASTVVPFKKANDTKVEAGTVCLRIFRGELSNSDPSIAFADNPIFDSRIELSWFPDGDKLNLYAKPVRIDYADTSAPVRGKGKKDVSIVLAFSSQTLQPGATPSAKPETTDAKAVIRLDLGRLEVGKQYDKRLLGTIRGASTLGSSSATTLTAVTFESEGADPALDAFIAAWDSNKGDLASALKKALAGGD
jgi:hypothetical protein